MVTFSDFWEMLYNHGARNYYQNAAYMRWSELTPGLQQQLFDRIRRKIDEGRFVDFNPLEAIHDNLPRRATVKKQILSYNEYYSLFRTTTPKDGWQMETDDYGKVVYTRRLPDSQN